MTARQLHRLEAQLKRRGYRKCNHAVTSRETYGWLKTFGEEGNRYQIEFRVWDWTPYRDTADDPYGFDVCTFPCNGENNYMVCGWQPLADISAFERLAADFNSFIRQHITPEKAK